jgi:hypothetical protein
MLGRAGETGSRHLIIEGIEAPVLPSHSFVIPLRNILFFLRYLSPLNNIEKRKKNFSKKHE